MGFVKFLFNSGVYLAAILGIFTLLPLPNNVNVSFNEYSVSPEKPFIGPLELNEKLSGISKLYENQIKGPESLLYYNNSLYASLHYGHIVKLDNDKIIPIIKFGKICDGLHEEHICGRPLGFTVDKNGFLYVTDAYYGVYKIKLTSSDQYDSKEQIVSMNDLIDGVRPKIPNAIVVASDGTVYWTDSDTNFSLNDGFYSMFVDGTGRVLKYNPKTKKNTVLMKNLQFSNGIELSNDESFLIVAESGKYRVLKYYLRGPKTGTTEVFIDGLPGWPDNIKKNSKGTFYLPFVMSRVPIFSDIGRFPTIRMIVVKFFALLQNTFQMIDSFYPNIYCKKAFHLTGHYESSLLLKPFIKTRLTILKVDENGNILSSFHATDGKISGISDVEVVGNKLYLGSPFNEFCGVIDLPKGFL